MAITGALTLAEIARVTQSKPSRGIMQGLLRYSDLLKVVPWKTLNTLEVKGQRYDTLPTVAFRGLNEGYTPGGGTTTPFANGMSFLGGSLKIDEQLLNLPPDQFIEHPRVTQVKMKLIAMSIAFGYYFIWGSKGNAEKEFNGINALVSNLPSRQTLSFGTNLDVTASAANSQTFINKLYELNDLVGGADLFLMNRKMRLGTRRALQKSGLLTTQKDAFDREWDTLFNAKIVDAGVSDPVTATETEIIPDDYNSTNNTIVYAVKFGEDALQPVQKNTLSMKDKGEDPDTPTHIYEIDWGVTLHNSSRYSIAKGTGILDPRDWS